MKIYYGKAVYGKEEIQASLNVLKQKSLSLIDGPSVKKLEYLIAKNFGKKINDTDTRPNKKGHLHDTAEHIPIDIHRK